MKLKILSIGNSFSVDTMEHLAHIAIALGFEKILLGNLHMDGCSVNGHLYNAKNGAAAYAYSLNDGSGWTRSDSHTIEEILKSENWDYISIQHGTGDKSRYTLPESYSGLAELVTYIKSIANENARIAFNMAWVMEPDFEHHEMIYYKGNAEKMYEDLASVTRDVISNVPGIDIVSPTGTAIQNARTSAIEKLTRDGIHLNYDVGRYTAGITFLKALTGVDIDGIKWKTRRMNTYMRNIAVESANNAIKKPYSVTPSKINV